MDARRGSIADPSRKCIMDTSVGCIVDTSGGCIDCARNDALVYCARVTLPRLHKLQLLPHLTPMPLICFLRGAREEIASRPTSHGEDFNRSADAKRMRRASNRAAAYGCVRTKAAAPHPSSLAIAATLRLSSDVAPRHHDCARGDDVAASKRSRRRCNRGLVMITGSFEGEINSI